MTRLSVIIFRHLFPRCYMRNLAASHCRYGFSFLFLSLLVTQRHLRTKAAHGCFGYQHLSNRTTAAKRFWVPFHQPFTAAFVDPFHGVMSSSGVKNKVLRQHSSGSTSLSGTQSIYTYSASGGTVRCSRGVESGSRRRWWRLRERMSQSNSTSLFSLISSEPSKNLLVSVTALCTYRRDCYEICRFVASSSDLYDTLRKRRVLPSYDVIGRSSSNSSTSSTSKMSCTNSSSSGGSHSSSDGSTSSSNAESSSTCVEARSAAANTAASGPQKSSRKTKPGQQQQGSSLSLPAALQGKCCFVDIGVNLTDPMYQGIYHSHEKHPPDLDRVIARARAVGCTRLLVTGGSLEDSEKALALCRSLDPKGSFLFATVGVHPTRCNDFLESSQETKGTHQTQEPHFRMEPLTQQQMQADSQTKERANEQLQRHPQSLREQPNGSAEDQRNQVHQTWAPRYPTEGIEGHQRESERDAEAHLKDVCAKFASSICLTPEDLQHLRKLYVLIAKNRDRVAAIGEIGLDNDRTHFCAPDTQKSKVNAPLQKRLLDGIPRTVLWFFELQLLLSKCFSLPLFLHMRSADEAFCEILARNKALWEASGGVVHSFTGDKFALDRVLSLSPSLAIGVNGCSLKTSENLEVVRSIPLQRLHLETDAPWCEIRPAHAAYAVLQKQQPELLAWHKNKAEKWSEDAQVKSRNEPCNIVQDATVVTVHASVCGKEGDVYNDIFRIVVGGQLHDLQRWPFFGPSC